MQTYLYLALVLFLLSEYLLLVLLLNQLKQVQPSALFAEQSKQFVMYHQYPQQDINLNENS